MSLAVKSEAPPIVADAAGTLRIAGTRVLLDLVVQAFRDGATPEAIVQRYSTLTLSDVYSVIAYYLRHTEEVDAYITEGERIAEQWRERIPARTVEQAHD